MGFADLVRDVEERQKTLTVFNPDPDDPVVDEIDAFFAHRAVEICVDATPSGRPGNIAVLEVDGSLVSVIAVDTLLTIVEQTVDSSGSIGVDEEPFRHVLDQIEEETFTSSSPAQMLATSKEIEDRAFRVGSGRLYATFQAASNLVPQRGRYAEIASTGVDVSIYLPPSESVPAVGEATVHQIDHPDVHDFWCVAFDGGDQRHQQSALLAEERAPNQYYGFWTYDPDVVEDVVAFARELEVAVAT